MPPRNRCILARVLEAGTIVCVLVGACTRSPEPVPATETRSALTGAKTPEQAAIRKLRDRTQRRATLDDLKARLASMPESTERRALAQELRATFDGYVSGDEGLAARGNADAIPIPPARTPEQTTSLLAKMSQYDLKKPSDAAEWARVKAQELGQ